MVEVTKGVDSDRNNLEHVQNEHGENCELIDVEAQTISACWTQIMIKCVRGIKIHGDIIRNICKCNVTVVCPISFETENWEHVMKCSTNKNDWDEWITKVGEKLKRAKQHKHAGADEKEIGK